MDYHIALEPDRFYHIFSRAIGNETLFKESKNYNFFLERYKKYIAPIADTYTYCLLPNHFHFLIRIKSEETLRTNGISNAEKIMQNFSNFLNSYTKAYNKLYNRRGSLFMDYLRRVKVEDNIN